MTLSENCLHKYQLKAIEFIIRKKKCCLFLEMGLGKTVSTLTALKHLFQKKKINKVLIICPPKVCKAVWMKEASLWGHLIDLDLGHCYGTIRNRDAILKKNHKIIILSKDLVKWFFSLSNNFNIKEYDCLVIDESSTFKSYKSQRFKELKKHIKNFKYRILLSGTPNPNSLIDLYSQIYLIDEGRTLEKNITLFRKKYCNPHPNIKFVWVMKPNIKKKISNKINPFCLSMKSEDYIELPKRINISEIVYMDSKTKKDYKSLKNDLFLELNNGIDIEAPNKLVLIQKLLQFTSGFLYNGKKYGVNINKIKIERIMEIILDNPYENFIIVYNFVHELKKLKQSFPQGETLQTGTIDRWNKNKISILFLQSNSSCYGLNLQKGGSIIIWHSLTWSYENYEQLNSRLYRQGQIHPVRIINMIMKDTIDEKILQSLRSKKNIQDYILEELKAG